MAKHNIGLIGTLLPRNGLLLLGSLIFFASPIFAQTTTSYTYDSLGRVTLSDATNNDASSYKYDDAGNIERAQASSLGVAGLNAPPDCTPVLRIASASSYSISGLTNCTDPNGDPMTVVSATDPAGAASVAISGNTLIFSNLPAGTTETDVTISDGNGGTTVNAFGIYYSGGGGFPF